MIVHLVDGTYELFRHRVKGFASRGLMLGVATDHVIESFRNRLWADYKTGAGLEPALLAQSHPLEVEPQTGEVNFAKVASKVAQRDLTSSVSRGCPRAARLSTRSGRQEGERRLVTFGKGWENFALRRQPLQVQVARA